MSEPIPSDELTEIRQLLVETHSSLRLLDAYEAQQRELEMIVQTRMNAWECSKCHKAANEPICTYCVGCYSELQAENEQLRALVDDYKLRMENANEAAGGE